VKSNVEKLTNRELEVFRLMGEGKMTSEIAEALAVSVKTIDTHRLRIKEKLNLKSSSELIKYAVEWANQNS
jgi:DNA-binding CsgD family transcriptional regulator